MCLVVPGFNLNLPADDWPECAGRRGRVEPAAGGLRLCEVRVTTVVGVDDAEVCGGEGEEEGEGGG